MGDCPSDKWFFGSVFVFLIAVGLLAGGAVNMQLAADDPRTPRVKTYDGYVDAWQSTHFDEYSGKYASTTPTISVVRGASADTRSTTTVSAWQKLETGLAAIGLKDSRSDYKRHNKHFALYTEIANFHATGKKSEKKKSMKTSAASTAGRNADLIPYQSDTIALADAMDELFAMDLYSTAREPAIKQLQTKANDWTGKYCPGGSSKQASGRSMYNAVNQLLGHFASNGLAPLPSARMEVVNKNIETARELIAQGR